LPVGPFPGMRDYRDCPNRLVWVVFRLFLRCANASRCFLLLSPLQLIIFFRVFRGSFFGSAFLIVLFSCAGCGSPHVLFPDTSTGSSFFFLLQVTWVFFAFFFARSVLSRLLCSIGNVISNDPLTLSRSCPAPFSASLFPLCYLACYGPNRFPFFDVVYLYSKGFAFFDLVGPFPSPASP